MGIKYRPSAHYLTFQEGIVSNAEKQVTGKGIGKIYPKIIPRIVSGIPTDGNVVTSNFASCQIVKYRRITRQNSEDMYITTRDPLELLKIEVCSTARPQIPNRSQFHVTTYEAKAKYQ